MVILKFFENCEVARLFSVYMLFDAHPRKATRKSLTRSVGHFEKEPYQAFPFLFELFAACSKLKAHEFPSYF